MKAIPIPKDETGKIANVEKTKGLKFLRTQSPVTWCAGCPNYSIMEGARRAVLNLMKQGWKREDFVMVAGIGCHGKIYDYININGFNALHGRALPTALGIKLGNPNLKVMVFAGDGDNYSEGMEHFIHMGRFNPNMTLIVHDNQGFSLTTGQATPITQIGYKKSKAEPYGEVHYPMNPLKLALMTNVGFIARCNARDFTHTAEIIEKAMKYNGFAFVEIIQDCIIFNTEVNNRDERMYKVESKKRTFDEAMKLASEYDYNSKDGKIPLGIIFQDDSKIPFDEKFPPLKKLKDSKTGWIGFKRN